MSESVCLCPRHCVSVSGAELGCSAATSSHKAQPPGSRGLQKSCPPHDRKLRLDDSDPEIDQISLLDRSYSIRRSDNVKIEVCRGQGGRVYWGK